MHRASDGECRILRAHAAKEVAILRAVFDERDPDLVREPYHLACEEIAGVCHKAADLLEEAEADALAHLDFPYAHHRWLRTDNVQERANREPKRRSRVAQSSRQGARLSACSALSSPRWTKTGQAGDGSRRSRSPKP